MISAPGPLDGIRVVEFDAIGPVPLAAMILADMGADVVRIARPESSVDSIDGVTGIVLHRNRPHLSLDLKLSKDRDIALNLTARSDAILEGFRPGVMERLGLGPDICLERSPSLAYVRITGWGQEGPLAPRAGHDLNYIGLTGVLAAMGEAGRPPPVPLNLIGDYGGGAMFAVSGLLAAVLSARTTGKGQVVDVAMTDGVSALSAVFHALIAQGLWQDRPGVNLLDGSRPFYRCYGCSDGGHVAVAALEPQFFANLLVALELDPDRFAQHDPDKWPDMERIFAEIFAQYPRGHWETVFRDVDACVTPVLSFGEAARHPHNVARETFTQVDNVAQPAPSPRFKTTALEITPQRRSALSHYQALRRWENPKPGD